MAGISSTHESDEKYIDLGHFWEKLDIKKYFVCADLGL
jgi:hypothetical protein